MTIEVAIFGLGLTLAGGGAGYLFGWSAGWRSGRLSRRLAELVAREP